MSITQISLSEIKTELLRIVGNFDSSTHADWQTDANLYRIINRYGQTLPARITAVAQSAVPLYHDMWLTTVTSTATAGALNLVKPAGLSQLYLPQDVDAIIDVWDNNVRRQVDVVYSPASKYFIAKLIDKPAGAPEVIEILGYSTAGGYWRRTANVYPAWQVDIGSTILTMNYYRIPALMAGSAPDSEYPDVDPKYQMLWIYGPAAELLGPANPMYDRYHQKEIEILADLIVKSHRLTE